MIVLEVVPRRLNDKMQMSWLPSCMRPEANIDLIRVKDGVYGLGDAKEQRTQFLGFLFG